MQFFRVQLCRLIPRIFAASIGDTLPAILAGLLKASHTIAYTMQKSVHLLMQYSANSSRQV